MMSLDDGNPCTAELRPLDHAGDYRGSHLTADTVLRNPRPLATRHFPR